MTVPCDYDMMPIAVYSSPNFCQGYGKPCKTSAMRSVGEAIRPAMASN